MQACTSWKMTKQNPAVYIVEHRHKQSPENQHTATDTSLFRDETQSETLGHPYPEVSPPQEKASHLALCRTQRIYTKKPYFLLSPCSNSSSQRGKQGAEVRQRGEVSVSYYSLINTSTFLFWDNSIISASHREVDKQMLWLDTAAQSALSRSWIYTARPWAALSYSWLLFGEHLTPVQPWWIWGF